MLPRSCKPAIVIVAFKRPNTLARILHFITKANFQGYEDIPLIISIDKSDCLQVTEIAQKFVWVHGTKRIIQQNVNLGLRKHIISCGDLTEEYEAVIVLEDDLIVSPGFYDYAVQAMQFYENTANMSGISLYSYDFNEYAETRFSAIHDGYDNYFIQTASSWGQLWTRDQWRGFKSWYELNESSSWNITDPLPDKLSTWPETSWKKYFIRYMVLEKKYFVYPRISLTTNSGDSGTNHRGTTNNYQVPLLLRRKLYRFSTFENSISIYDSHYEIEAQCLKLINSDLKEIDFECDLNGTKNLLKVKADYLLSIRDCDRPDLSYALSLVPQELNVVFGVPGNFFNLAKATNFGQVSVRKQMAQLRHINKNLGWRRYSEMLRYTLQDSAKKWLRL